MSNTIQTQLWEIAVDHYGYVTSDDAHRLDINVVELGKLAHRNQLQRVGYGIYRFAQLPVTQYDPYQVAVLWAGSRGSLSHDTAIDLYELAEANPDLIHLTVPVGYRPRRQDGDLYVVHHGDLADADVRLFEGIPIVKPAVAIAQVIETGMPTHLVRHAIETARGRGQITTNQQSSLSVALEQRC
jgi:predicted transcriptional regulator of viral defense system